MAATGPEETSVSLTLRQKAVGAVLVFLAGLATVAGYWSFLHPQPTPEQHVVVSSAPDQERWQGRAGEGVREFTRVQVKVVDDGVILLREVQAPPRRTFTPGQPITLYRDPLGELSVSKDIPSRLLLVVMASFTPCIVTACVFTVVARRMRRRSATA